MNFNLFILCILMLPSSIFLPLNGMNLTGLRKAYRSWERLNARIFKPHDVPVFMNDAQAITLASDATQPITLSTAGLTGCVATMLYAHKYHQHAILTHFQPNDDYTKEHVMELERQAQLLQVQINKCNVMKFIIIMPRCAYSDDKEFHDILYKKIYTKLTCVIQKTYCLSDMNILHAFYEQAPMGKGYTTNVQVTLSNSPYPSICTINNWALDQTFDLEKTINNS